MKKYAIPIRTVVELFASNGMFHGWRATQYPAVFSELDIEQRERSLPNYIYFILPKPITIIGVYKNNDRDGIWDKNTMAGKLDKWAHDEFEVGKIGAYEEELQVFEV